MISTATSVRFKVATEGWEFDQISRLNHRTFVEEIPQHLPAPDGRLVDALHAHNTYLVGVKGDRVIAMVAWHGDRPFSLDAKLADLDEHLPAGRRVCEIRLLAIDPAHRGGAVLHGLLWTLTQQLVREGYDLAIISGTLRQLRLYRHLGFVPFGPVVGSAAAPYQPMYLRVEDTGARAIQPAVTLAQPKQDAEPMRFLPGPVDLSARVVAALAEPAVSHRCETFVTRFEALRRRLCQLTAADSVQVMAGSGTLANDAIAAQLSLRREQGLMLTSGEFGDRLIDHARRYGLMFDVVCARWGDRVEVEQVERELTCQRDIGWVWAVHCETSSGAMIDLPELKRLCRSRGVRLCLDCISSIGAAPVDLRDVWMASASSGKGLASAAGLAMVFHAQGTLQPGLFLPRCLDLELYERKGGIPFTVPSPVLYALAASLTEITPKRFADIRRLAAYLRRRLVKLGQTPLTPQTIAGPAVTTLVLPAAIPAVRVTALLEKAGILLAHQSDHLMRRNAVQICLFGHRHTEAQIDQLLDGLWRALEACRA